MPIHVSILNPRQAEAGKIKIGGLGEERQKSDGTGTWRRPKKLDHFLVTKTIRDSETGEFEVDEDLMRQLPKCPDGKCREIPVLFDSDLIEEVFPHALASYSGRTLACKGDGTSAMERTKNGAGFQARSCPCDKMNAKKGIVCKPHGSLWVTIAAGKETRIGARHCFRTTSWNSIRWILSGLDAIQRQVGTIVGIPCVLVVRPHQVGTDSGPKIVHVVHVELRTKDLFALQNHAIHAISARRRVAAVATQPIVLGLPSPGERESTRDQQEIQEEYYPEDDGESYDPETGEVYDVDAVDERPIQPEDESQDPPQPNPDDPLPEEHPARSAMKDRLTEIARLRSFSDADLAMGRREIWAEACKAASLDPVLWKNVTTRQAMAIDVVLRGMVRAGSEGE